MKANKTYETKDDQHNISATFEREHTPVGFRPHEIKRVTVPEMATIQEAQRQAGEEITTNTRDAFKWLMLKAGLKYSDDWADVRPMAQREEARKKAEAKAQAQERKTAHADATTPTYAEHLKRIETEKQNVLEALNKYAEAHGGQMPPAEAISQKLLLTYGSDFGKDVLIAVSQAIAPAEEPTPEISFL